MRERGGQCERSAGGGGGHVSRASKACEEGFGGWFQGGLEAGCWGECLGACPSSERSKQGMISSAVNGGKWSKSFLVPLNVCPSVL